MPRLSERASGEDLEKERERARERERESARERERGIARASLGHSCHD